MSYWTILVNTKQYYAKLDNIRIFLTILDNIISFLRILLQLRKDRAEIATWTRLNNIRQYWTILYCTILHNIVLYNIAQYWIPQKQTYAIPKFSVPFLFFSSHGRVLEELSLLKTRLFPILPKLIRIVFPYIKYGPTNLNWKFVCYDFAVY